VFFNKLIRYYTQFKKPLHLTYDWLLPRLCILCGYSTQSIYSICEPCQKDLPILPHNCQQCAQFLRFTSQLKCGACLSQPPDFDATYALFPYDTPIDRLITKLKFQQQLIYAKTFGELMASRINASWYANKPLPDLIIPIPLHPARLAERGFNQSLEISRYIARRLHIPIDYQRFTRTKATLAQSGLSANARQRNIAKAFNVSGSFHGLKIALVDDVITTGSTVIECSRMLKKNGAAQIDIWCCARNG
jgi:ComF family protein